MNGTSDDERGPGWDDDPLRPEDMRWYTEGARADTKETAERNLEAEVDEVCQGLWAEVGAIARAYLDLQGMTELDGVLTGIARRLVATGVLNWPPRQGCG